MLEILKKILPKQISQYIEHRLSLRYLERKYEKLPSYKYLRNLMDRYQTKDLINVDKESFRRKIDNFISIQDWKMEGYKSTKKQTLYSTKFIWGHNHDFGDFSLEGRMRNRHIWLIATFIDKFKIIPRDLSGLKILDIGSWTGGTSLLLSAMGAHVVAVEEIKKYSDCLNYLKYAFDIKNLDVKNISLFDCTSSDFQDSFDFILFCGVLYHVTDPPLALRILFNSLKNGGALLLETLATNSNKNILSYRVPIRMFKKVYFENPRAGGWDWFIPAPLTVKQMLIDVGYEDIRVGKIIHRRLFAVGKRNNHVDMNRSGFSKRFIR